MQREDPSESLRESLGDLNMAPAPQTPPTLSPPKALSKKKLRACTSEKD